MIRNRTWRAAAIGCVLAADLVVLLVCGARLPGFVPFALGLLAVATVWALARPAGSGALALVVVQVLCIGTVTGAPASTGGWALAAVAAAAVIVTHLALTLLGSWPRRADLPRETARRWVTQAAALVWVGITVAAVGAVAALTPQGWAPWLGAVALVLVAATTWQVRIATRRR